MAEDVLYGMTCPRRVHPGSGGRDYWRSDGTCSYCGSLDPDSFMARLEAGDVTLTPTDKPYKVYVENRGGPGFKRNHRDCPPDSPCTGPDDCTHWRTREVGRVKFYFQHLRVHQMQRFIELNNAGRLHIEYPGHFYVLPFFCKVESHEQAENGGED